jgi:hypothetical protein
LFDRYFSKWADNVKKHGKPGQIYLPVVQLIDLLPFLKIRQVILKIMALDEHRLAIATALNNMVGKTGHNHPGLSWHQRLLASDTQNPFCALAADINRSAERVGSGSN